MSLTVIQKDRRNQRCKIMNNSEQVEKYKDMEHFFNKIRFKRIRNINKE